WRLHRAARAEPAPAPVPPPQPPPEPTEPTGEGKPFSIEQTASLPDLYPGEAPEPIPLRLENPNPVPISVTALRAAIAADPPGCPSAENFVITPSDASVTMPLAIPAESSVELPAQGISPPAIAMLELPVSQDACQGANLTIELEGEAVG
ncbi:MAG: hypothetical protein H0X42_08545, partial [Solirubrobacterales bacterium]|nr:hypothetical protein [Solirubrobacterales bacterium]